MADTIPADGGRSSNDPDASRAPRAADVAGPTSPAPASDGPTADASAADAYTPEVTEEQAVRLQHQTDAVLAAIIQSSDDAIVSKTLDGVVRTWNDGARRIFGYTAEEMIGTPIERLLPPERRGEEVEILRRLRRGERVDHFETIRVRKDGVRIDGTVTI